RMVEDGARVDLGAPLQAVLDAVKLAQHGPQRAGVNAAENRDGRRRQCVLDVVLALEEDIFATKDLMLAAAVAEHRSAGQEKRSAVELLAAAELVRLRGYRAGDGESAVIVRVADGKIRRLLVHEDPLLGCDVVLERVVAVHVIGRQIQKGRDRRAELVNGLELKARELRR